MMQLSALCIAVVGVIHLLPLVGVLGAERLNTLYGIAVGEPNLALLMRHRAVLFGLLGGVMLAGALHEPWRLLAYGLAWVSVVSFMLLAASQPGLNAAVLRVVKVDWVAVVFLLVGTAALWRGTD